MPSRIQIQAQSDLKRQYVFQVLFKPYCCTSNIFHHDWKTNQALTLFPCGIWNHRFNKLRRYIVYCSKMASAVLAHLIYLVRNHTDYSKEMWGINLATIASLTELEETQMFLTSEIQMFEISPLLQHQALSLERIFNISDCCYV